MKVQINIPGKIFKLLRYKSNLKFLFIFNVLISVFIFDLVEAGNNNATLNSNEELAIDNLDSRSKLEDLNLDSETIELILKNAKNRTEIDINYLNPKNELEDYIVDTGDSLLIEFKNKPRGIGLIELEYDPENISYLNPRNDLSNYKLDEGDVLDIKFTYIPEFNRQYPIDQEGEIYLPELGSVYVKGLNIYQAKDLLEKKYEKYLKFTDMEIRINQFRFMDSGIYSINNEGELMLPLLKETYVRGLTTSEISNLLSKKYLNSENIYTEVEIRIASFKPQRILVSGEIRNPGIYKFPGFSSGEFLAIENIEDDTSQKGEIKNDAEESISKEIYGDNMTKGQLNRRESNRSLNQNPQNNTARQNFQIKRPSENFTTISNVLRKAGGITSKTDLSRIEIIRDIPIGKGGGKQRAVVDFTSFINESDPTNDIRLFDGDRIFLPKLASASLDIIPKSILSGLSPRFITVDIFGRVENPGSIKLPLEATLSDAIDLTGPIRPLSGKIVLIRYNKDGTVLKKNISYSARAKRGSRRNPFVKEGDLISVKNSFLGKSTGVIQEFTAPFIGIYSTKEIIESFND
ncbi:polysaccharide biosynthesis/export family protein [Prochlorococcus marinus]|uniref:polysaccharide biosynthesis/export family protein n=1 Tax=Prochlorococcus marinus TaxID=1219 RepID=UPI001FD6D7E0|nr:polysaccharide biosynthesis/export family protein [Prochlorococcus marinus]